METEIKITDWFDLDDKEKDQKNKKDVNDDDDEILKLKFPHPKEIAAGLYATLNIVGCNPTNRTLYRRFLWGLNFGGQLFWLVSIPMYNVCCALDMGEFLEHIMFVAIVMQVIIKFAIGAIYEKNLAEILHILFNVFWSEENLIKPAKKIYITYNIILHKLILFYKYLFIFSIFLVAGETMYATPMKPVTKVWSPKHIDFNNDQPYAFGFLAGQLINLAGCVIVTIVPYDNLFIMMTGSAYIQIECLKCTIVNMDCKDVDLAYKDLIKYLKYHNLLLSYLKKIEGIYAISLMSQLSASILTICIAIYLWQTNENLIVRAFLYAMLSSAQLLVYCFGGQMITDQSASLASAVFESKWWKLPDKNFRGGLIMMIQRSQREVHISAGGVYILSMDLYMKILRASVSFMTLLKNSFD